MSKYILFCFGMLLSVVVLSNNTLPTTGTVPPLADENSANCDFVVVPTRNTPKCHGGTDGSISVQVLGNGAPFNYVWENGIANQPLQNIGSGNYTLTATDQFGCSKVETITLMENPPISLSLYVRDIPCFMFCDGSVGTIVSGGTGNFTFLWSTGATTGVIENLPPGWYSVTVTDDNGCTKSDSAFVYEPTEIIVSVVSTSGACGGSTGSATVTATGGTPPYKYIWSNGEMGATLSNAPAGLYYVCVIDANGCQKDLFVTIAPSPGLDVQIAVSSAQCPGVANAVATATVNPSSGNLVYAWSVPGAPPVSQLTGLSAGQSVSVTVTDVATGCIGEATASVGAHNQVKVEVSDVDVVCANDTNGSAIAVANSGTAPYTYEWFLPGGVKISGDQISGLTAGAYMVSVTDAVGCTAVGVADIAAISQLSADFQVNLAACVGNNEVLVNFSDKSSDPSSAVASWQWNIAWSTGNQQFSTQNPAPIQLPNGEQGTAQLTVTSAAGCTAFVSQVFTAPQSDLQLNIQTQNTDCASNPIGMAMVVPIGGAAPFNFLWNNSANSQQISNLPAGNYAVTVSDAKNCTATAMATIDATSDLTPNIAFEVVECLGNQVVVNFYDQSTDPNGAIISWNWNILSTAGQLQFGIQNPGDLTFPDKTTGTVQLTVTSAAGCVETISQPFVVDGLPDIDFNIDIPAVKCGNEPVNIVVTGSNSYTYTWSPTNGLDISNAGQNVIANPSQNTTYNLLVKNAGCEKNIEVPVMVSPEIQLTATPDKQTCDLASLLEASSTATGVTFQWLLNGAVVGNNSSIMVNNLGTQTYTVIATDPLGCTESKNVSVEGLGTPITLATIPQPACEKSDIELHLVSNDPNAQLTYQWNSNPPNLNIQPTNAANVTVTGTAGNYLITVVIVNQNNCESELTIPIEYFQGQTLDGKIAANTCNGLEVKFTNTSGVPGIWQFGDGSTSSQTNPTHLYANSGNFSVQFIPNVACVANFDSIINVSATPAIQADFKVDLKNCRDEAVFEITNLTQHTQPNVQWLWSVQPFGLTSTEANPTLKLLQAGPAIIILNVVDANGCFDADTLTVPYHIISDNFERNLDFCEGEMVELNSAFGTNYSYTWTATPPDPNLNVNIPNPTVQPTQKTTYSVLVSLGGCQVTDTVIVTPNPAAILTLPDPKIVCSDAPIQLTVGGNGATFQWSENENFNPIFATGNSVNVVPKRDGKYFVRSITDKNCSTIGQVFLNNGAVNITGKGNLDKMICLGMSTTLDMKTDAQPADILNYSWSPVLPMVASPVVSPTANTTYAGFVVNQFGCGDTAQFKIEVIALSAIATTEKDSVCPGETTLLNVQPSGGKNYQFMWMPENSLDNPRMQSPTASPTANTTYSVTVTDELGCSATATVGITFINLQCRPPFIFVPDAFSPNGDDKNDRFMARTAFAEKLYFAVYNRWGELMFETNDPKDLGWDGTYKGRALTPDAYGWYLKVNCPDGQEYSSKGNVTLLK